MIADRPREPGTPLSAALGELRRAEATEILLQPLGTDGIAQLSSILGGPTDPAAIEVLEAQSSGNPLYLEQLILAEGARPGGGIGSLPEGVAALVAERVVGLTAAARLTLEAAAVTGDPFDPELAAAAADLDPELVPAQVDVLLGEDFLAPTDVPRLFRFRHPIVRRAVHDGTPPGWRLQAHRRVAELLRERGAAPIERAHHVEHAALPGDREAIEVLTAAAAAVDDRSPLAAAHWYGAAERLLETGSEKAAGERLGLLASEARALVAGGEYGEADRVLARVQEMAGRAEPLATAPIVALRAKVEHLLGRHEAAGAMLERELGRIPAEPSTVRAELLLELGASAFFAGDFERQREILGRALAVAEATGDAGTLAAATGLLGCGSYMAGDAAAAKALLDEAEAMVAGLDDAVIAGHLHALAWIGICETYLEEFDRALKHLDRALAIARRMGNSQLPALLMIGQALALLGRGELDAGRARAELAVETNLLGGNAQLTSWSLWAQAWGSILAGDLDAALDQAGRSRDLATGDPVSAMGGAHLAETLLELGQPEEAREVLLAALGGPELPLCEVPFRSRWYELLVRAECRAADLEAAADWLQRAREAADGVPLDGRRCEVDRAQAVFELASGRAAEAAVAAQAAIEAAAAGDLAIDGARASMLLGNALAEQGDREAAKDALQAAFEVFDHTGAARWRDQAARELRGLGRRVRPTRKAATDTGVAPLAGLTRREAEVAGMVADGAKNREIAEQLVLSEKTIESHIRNIFMKLGVDSRASVAAAVAADDRSASTAGG